MIPYHSIAELVFNTPLLVTPQAGDALGCYLLSRMRGGGEATTGEKPIEELQAFPVIQRPDGSAEVHSPRASRFIGEYPVDAETGRPAPYRLTKDGTAIITVVGKLVHRGAWVGASSGVTSYEGLKHQIAGVARDSRVKRTVIDMSSPGGEVSGCLDLSASIRNSAKVKPIVGLVNAVACSAGYSLLSGATRIVALPECQVGSIGVLLMHLDISMALQMDGIRPTIIHAGAHKIDGNPFEPLPKGVREDLQVWIDRTYEMFVATVAAGRAGKMTPESIRATEARVYRGEEALKIGLVDAVGTFEDLLAEMAEPSTVSIVINQGEAAKAEAASEGADMSLWTQLKAALGGVEPEAGAPGPGVADVVSPAPPAGGSRALADPSADQIEVQRLRAELKKRDEDAEAAVAAANAEAEKQRLASVETNADAFMAKHSAKFGKAGAATARARYVVAATANDTAEMTFLETLAAGLPDVGPSERIADPKSGPSAESLAVKADPKLRHFDTLDKLAAQGIGQSHPEFAAKYAQELTHGAATAQ